MTILLNNDDIREMLTMPDCLRVLEDAYTELGLAQAASRERSALVAPTNQPDDMFTLMTMDGILPKAGVGVVRVNSDFHHFFEVDGKLRRTKLPKAPDERFTGLAMLFSTETTEPLMIFTDGAVNPMRVAALSGLGVKHMARQDARTIALLGTGRQARTQAAAVANVRDVDVIRCFSPTGQNRVRFAAEMSKELGVNVQAADTAEQAIRGADVVICATNSKAVVFPAEYIEPGMHITCVTQFEMDPGVAHEADIAVCHMGRGEPVFISTFGLTHPEQAGANQNFAAEAGLADMPTIADVIAGNIKGRDTDSQVTCFLNTQGSGLQFAAVGALLYEKAKEAGRGHEIPTEWLTQKEVS